MVTFTRKDGLDRLGPAHRYYAYCIADLAMEMPVSGIFYRKKILSEKDIYDLAGVPEKYRLNLLKVLYVCGWIGRIGCLYYLKDVNRFAEKPVMRMAMTEIKKLVNNLSPEELRVLGLDNDREEALRRRLNELYSVLSSDQRKIAQLYLRRFMTKKQIEQNVSLYEMGIEKHVRLLEELIEMYQTGKLTFALKEYSFDRARFFEMVRYVESRELEGLTNHNYLKKVLMNGRYKDVKKNVEGF